MHFNFMNKNPCYTKYKIGKFTYGEPVVEDWWKHPGVTLQIGNFCSISKRVTDGQINSLLKIQWWNWDDEKIKVNIPYILNNNIEEFIKKFGDKK